MKIGDFIKVVLTDWFSSIFIPSKLRIYFLNKLIGSVDKSSYINFPNYFRGGNIIIGKGVFVNKFCRIISNPKAAIVIKKNTSIAYGVQMYTDTHEIGGEDRRAPHKAIFLPITIGEGCWIGANAIILPGVTIGNGVVVAAGAVVAKDLASNAVYGGVPAKLIRKL